MNFKKFITPMFALGALCLASCSSEGPLGDGPQYEEGEGIGFMAFTIANPESGTRAVGDENNFETDTDGEIFSNGDAQEYAICPNDQANVAFFFDSSNNFYSMCTLQGAANGNGVNKDNHPANDPYAKAEKYYTYITRWRNTNANPTPTQVIVVLNANPTELNELAQGLAAKGTEALNEVLNYKFNTYTAGNYTYGVYKYADNNYFTMTNSSFLDNEGKEAIVTDITGNIQDTAEKALANPAVVYVERLLAKYQLGFGSAGYELTGNDTDFTFKPFVTGDTKVNEAAKVNYVAEYLGEGENAIEGGNIDYPRYETKEWQVYVNSWGINGLEKEGRLIKDINTGRANYFTGWNIPTYHRSYWGASPLYALSGKDNFPTQYRSTQYDPNPDANFVGSNDGKTALHYISFDDLQTRARYKYTAERTYSDQEDGNKAYGPYRYASHYLIGAQLILTGIDTDVTTKDGLKLKNLADKWYAYNFYWGSEEDYIRYAYRRMAAQVADGRSHTINLGTTPVTVGGISDGYLYADAQGTKIMVSEAADYFKTAPAQLIHGDGKRVLSLKEGKTLYIRTGENTYTALNENQVLAMIYNFTDAVRHYNGGAMYYAIPVQHMQGKSNSANKVTIDKDATESYPFGQFATVRNHWYRLTVNTIGSIGTPVDDPEQPIIPDPEDEYHVALEIVVLPWHLIDNGSVGL